MVYKKNYTHYLLNYLFQILPYSSINIKKEVLICQQTIIKSYLALSNAYILKYYPML